MKKLIRKFWTDEAGFIISMELVLVATIVVIGLVAGLSQLRDSLVAELNDVGQAIGSLDQSFQTGSVAGTTITDGSEGSSFTDAIDATAGDQQAGDASNLVFGAGSLTLAVGPEGAAGT